MASPPPGVMREFHDPNTVGGGFRSPWAAGTAHSRHGLPPPSPSPSPHHHHQSAPRPSPGRVPARLHDGSASLLDQPPPYAVSPENKLLLKITTPVVHHMPRPQHNHHQQQSSLIASVSPIPRRGAAGHQRGGGGALGHSPSLASSSRILHSPAPFSPPGYDEHHEPVSAPRSATRQQLQFGEPAVGAAGDEDDEASLDAGANGNDDRSVGFTVDATSSSVGVAALPMAGRKRYVSPHHNSSPRWVPDQPWDVSKKPAQRETPLRGSRLGATATTAAVSSVSPRSSSPGQRNATAAALAVVKSSPLPSLEEMRMHARQIHATAASFAVARRRLEEQESSTRRRDILDVEERIFKSLKSHFKLRIAQAFSAISMAEHATMARLRTAHGDPTATLEWAVVRKKLDEVERWARADLETRWWTDTFLFLEPLHDLQLGALFARQMIWEEQAEIFARLVAVYRNFVVDVVDAAATARRLAHARLDRQRAERQEVLLIENGNRERLKRDERDERTSLQSEAALQLMSIVIRLSAAQQRQALSEAEESAPVAAAAVPHVVMLSPPASHQQQRKSATPIVDVSQLSEVLEDALNVDPVVHVQADESTHRKGIEAAEARGRSVLLRWEEDRWAHASVSARHMAYVVSGEQSSRERIEVAEMNQWRVLMRVAGSATKDYYHSPSGDGDYSPDRPRLLSFPPPPPAAPSLDADTTSHRPRATDVATHLFGSDFDSPDGIYGKQVHHYHQAPPPPPLPHNAAPSLASPPHPYGGAVVYDPQSWYLQRTVAQPLEYSPRSPGGAEPNAHHNDRQQRRTSSTSPRRELHHHAPVSPSHQLHHHRPWLPSGKAPDTLLSQMPRLPVEEPDDVLVHTYAVQAQALSVSRSSRSQSPEARSGSRGAARDDTTIQMSSIGYGHDQSSRRSVQHLHRGSVSTIESASASPVGTRGGMPVLLHVSPPASLPHDEYDSLRADGFEGHSHDQAAYAAYYVQQQQQQLQQHRALHDMGVQYEPPQLDGPGSSRRPQQQQHAAASSGGSIQRPKPTGKAAFRPFPSSSQAAGAGVRRSGSVTKGAAKSTAAAAAAPMLSAAERLEKFRLAEMSRRPPAQAQPPQHAAAAADDVRRGRSAVARHDDTLQSWPHSGGGTQTDSTATTLHARAQHQPVSSRSASATTTTATSFGEGVTGGGGGGSALDADLVHRFPATLRSSTDSQRQHQPAAVVQRRVHPVRTGTRLGALVQPPPPTQRLPQHHHYHPSTDRDRERQPTYHHSAVSMHDAAAMTSTETSYGTVSDATVGARDEDHHHVGQHPHHRHDEDHHHHHEMHHTSSQTVNTTTDDLTPPHPAAAVVPTQPPPPTTTAAPSTVLLQLPPLSPAQPRSLPATLLDDSVNRSALDEAMAEVSRLIDEAATMNDDSTPNHADDDIDASPPNAATATAAAADMMSPPPQQQLRSHRWASTAAWPQSPEALKHVATPPTALRRQAMHALLNRTPLHGTDANAPHTGSGSTMGGAATTAEEKLEWLHFRDRERIAHQERAARDVILRLMQVDEDFLLGDSSPPQATPSDDADYDAERAAPPATGYGNHRRYESLPTTRSAGQSTIRDDQSSTSPPPSMEHQQQQRAYQHHPAAAASVPVHHRSTGATGTAAVSGWAAKTLKMYDQAPRRSAAAHHTTTH